jgi:hypothetical protein
MPTTCFMITPTDQAQYFLHVFTLVGCTAGYGHKAKVQIESGPLLQTPEGYIAALTAAEGETRWPTVCDVCGEPFPDHGVVRQIYQEPLLLMPDGREVTIAPGSAPPGAMWDTPWMVDCWQGKDGRCLTVRLPSGEDWCIDSQAASGGFWTRTGEPPLLTVTPSIKSNRYHGYLNAGVLTDDMDAHTRS